MMIIDVINYTLLCHFVVIVLSSGDEATQPKKAKCAARRKKTIPAVKQGAATKPAVKRRAASKPADKQGAVTYSCSFQKEWIDKYPHIGKVNYNIFLW